MTTPWQAKIFAVSVRKKEKWHYAREAIRKHVHPTSRCLDVGSGVGTLSMLQEKIGGRWEFTETDKEAAAQTALVVKGTVHTVDIFDPSLPAGVYDLITVFDVIEHVPDPQAFMDRLAALLAPHGALILTTPADDGSYYFWRRLAEKYFGIDKAAHGHVVEGFARGHLQELSRKAGLLPLECIPFSFAFTEFVELLYNGAYILKNRRQQRTAGYNLALSPASPGDVTRHRWQLGILQTIYPLLRSISLIDRLGLATRGYEWLLVAKKPGP
ncbi:MAG: class I SAM-dependent methyltransferase [Candidatus Andersenbacteria bacterium]|nr:class I SAM-dependent methyltransferase [Candidatus Andersenbacteria bacterium]